MIKKYNQVNKSKCFLFTLFFLKEFFLSKNNLISYAKSNFILVLSYLFYWALILHGSTALGKEYCETLKITNSEVKEKNQLLVPQNIATTDVVTMTNGSSTTCNAQFYDSGGASSNYSNSENYSYTFTPSPGYVLKVVFNSFATESGYDGLVIYDGVMQISSGLTSGTNTVNCPAGSFYGTNSPGTIFSSTANGGALTFKFRSDSSITKTGWSATITCVSLLTITSFNPSAACSGATPIVTITGTNFTGATSVKFNDVAASSFLVVNDTTITATLPTGVTSGLISISNSTVIGYSTTSFNIKPVPTLVNAGSDVAICAGNSINLSGTAQGTISNTVLNQDFNAGPFPAGWIRTSSDFKTSYEYVSAGNTWLANGYTGYCSYFWSFILNNGYSSDMISPILNLSTYTTANLTFWIYNSSGTDTLNVYANNNGGTYSQVGTTYSTYGAWTQISISLNSFVGANGNAVTIKFTGTSDYGYSNIGIDDIIVTGSSTPTNTWSPATGLSAINLLNPIANPIDTTTYTLTSSYGNGCSVSDDIVVTVNPKPIVSISTPVSGVCPNSVTIITATGNGDTYTWTSSLPNTLFMNLSATIAYIPGTSATSIFVKSVTTINITVTATMASTGCLASSNGTFMVLPGITNTWDGSSWSSGAPGSFDSLIINGDYTSGSLQGCNCKVISGEVDFNSGESLSLFNELAVTGGSITFNDSSSLLQINNVANTGNITYKRTTQPINRFDYNYWSTPVTPQTLIGLSPNTLFDKYFYYDATVDNWTTLASSANMVPGIGYIIRGPQTYDLLVRQAFTGVFTGVPNNGTIATPIVLGKYNLIGNPYPSAISADLFLSNLSNALLVDGTIYLWTHNTPVTNLQYNSSDYAVYNYLGGTGTISAPSNGFNTSIPNGKIASGESFFIKGIGNGTATFLNSMRLSGNNNQFFKNNSVPTSVITHEKHRIWLGVNDVHGGYKQTLVGYAPAATLGLDRGYDGELLNQTPVCVYSLSGATALSIQGRPMPFQVSDEVPLGFHADTAGTFTFSLYNFDGLFVNQDIFLEDKLSSVIHDLKGSNYTFVSAAGTFENRFVLRYTNSALNTNETIFSEESVIVYKNNQNIMINAHNIILKSVAIFDVRGRELFNQNDIHSSQFEVTNFVSSKEVLLIKVISEEGRIIIKKIPY